MSKAAAAKPTELEPVSSHTTDLQSDEHSQEATADLHPPLFEDYLSCADTFAQPLPAPVPPCPNCQAVCVVRIEHWAGSLLHCDRCAHQWYEHPEAISRLRGAAEWARLRQGPGFVKTDEGFEGTGLEDSEQIPPVRLYSNPTPFSPAQPTETDEDGDIAADRNAQTPQQNGQSLGDEARVELGKWGDARLKEFRSFASLVRADKSPDELRSQYFTLFTEVIDRLQEPKRKHLYEEAQGRHMRNPELMDLIAEVKYLKGSTLADYRKEYRKLHSTDAPKP